MFQDDSVSQNLWREYRRQSQTRECRWSNVLVNENFLVAVQEVPSAWRSITWLSRPGPNIFLILFSQKSRTEFLTCEMLFEPLLGVLGGGDLGLNIDLAS